MTAAAPPSQVLARLYGEDSENLLRQARRWDELIRRFHEHFGAAKPRYFSAPGRIEIGGNHTDHNRGKVLAAAVDLDSIAAAAPADDGQVTIISEGYNRPFVVSVHDVAPHPAERETTSALIRGIAARFRQLGFEADGFRACIHSDVPVGSGLSSSASIEVLIATIWNEMHNGGAIPPDRIALIGQYAENVYFGKPSGLMDQITCATGGIVKIDFQDPDSPRIESIDFDFESSGYVTLVVDTGGSHADLTDEYASIPREMREVAAQFGREVCRQISEDDILGMLSEVRARVGDRAVLRALHFLRESRRVEQQVEALRRGDMPRFLRLIEESGSSSYRLLQNCLVPRRPMEQGIPLALALAENFVQAHGGACRVHGGGFAGTILVFLPPARSDGFRTLMESAFGTGCVRCLRIRRRGATELK